MAAVGITINQTTFARAREALNPRQLKQAMYQATLRTSRKLGVQVKGRVKESSNIPSKYLTAGQIDDGKHAIALLQPKTDPPSGGVRVTKVALPLKAFPNVATKTLGVTAIVAPGKSLRLRHAFAATMKSGHKGIFARRKLPVFTARTTIEEFGGIFGGTAAEIKMGFALARRSFVGMGMRKMTRLATGGQFPRVTKSGYARRLPIEELFGPSVYTVVNIPKVMSSILFDAGAEFEKQLNSQIYRFTNRR